jgi:hypothetical protein
VCGLFDLGDAVVEDRLYSAFDLAKDGCGEISSWEAYITALSQPGKRLGGKSRCALPISVDDPYLADHVSLAADFWQQPHAISDVESEPPKVDDVTTGS